MKADVLVQYSDSEAVVPDVKVHLDRAGIDDAAYRKTRQLPLLRIDVTS